MFIEVWSDIVCPFCYIGKRNLETALKEFSEPVQVVWRSFELDPSAPKQSPVNLPTHLATKYGQTPEWARAKTEDMTQKAAAVGLTFRLDKAVPTNSFDAHRLIHLAETFHRGGEMKERLLLAYFSEGQDISDHPTLSKLAHEVGLESSAVSALLAGDQWTEEVRTDERLARDLEISGVPFFVINQRFAISGAQPKDYFLESLHKIKARLAEESTHADNGKA